MQAAVHRALVCVETVHTLDRFPRTLRRTQVKSHVNSANHEHTFFIFNFTANFGRKPSLIRIDFARFQRATKGSNHSAGRRRNDIINCCSVRFADFAFIDAIVFGYRAMHTERHRFFFTWQICET